MYAAPKNYLGKLIGAVIGLFKGGLVGAVMGLVIGHIFDQWLAGGKPARRVQHSFFNSLFACMGYLAKMDGRVSEAEIAMAETLMRNMGLSADERREAIRQFNRGKQPGFNLHAELQPFSRMALLRPALRRMFVDILLAAALADGRLNAPERQVLEEVVTILHLPRGLLEELIAAQQAGGPGQRAQAGGQGTSDPYRVLGLEKQATVPQIKRAYRKLMSQYHPDKLVARGLPAEMMDMARQKAREINLAYDRIKESRGFK